MTTFAPGMRVVCRDAEWLITNVELSDDARQHFAVHCVGTDDLVRGHQAIFLTQLDDLEVVDPAATRLVSDESAGYRLTRLFVEAQLRQMPATGLTMDLTGLGVFKPMNYQRHSVELALNQLRPRLLLADAVGLGKTIEVGMILTELARQGRAKRILVLARKSMLTQFQAELWNRFTIPLVRLDSAGIAKLRLRIPANKNPFEVFQRVIISIDTLKNVGRYRHFLESTRWDVVVIDEAHNVAGASVPERHLAHRLARLLGAQSDAMLLTTATPHNGKRETFARLISLLDPSAIPDPKMREYDAEDIRGFFVQRFKQDVRDEAGEEMTDRQLAPDEVTSASASPAEEAVYEHLAQMRTESKLARERGESWGRQSLVLWGLYKLFLSSPEACRATLDKRRAKLHETDPSSLERPWLDELDRRLEGLSLTGSTRYQLLRKQLEDIGWTGRPASPRVVIFTESRRTQDALFEALDKDFKLRLSSDFDKQANQVLAMIHGGTPDIHLTGTIEAFATGSSPVRLLLTTDVASEGINLHHQCHDLIHYDLPWSIITLIQRNGRIDRYGQRISPVLRYLKVHSTQPDFKGDEHIFGRLVDKVEEINRSTRQGESVLKLYDPEAEERYIAEHGVVDGDAELLDKTRPDNEASLLEATLESANLRASDDFLAFLLGETEAGQTSGQPSDTIARPRIFSDQDFLIEGFRQLRQLDPELPEIEIGKQMITIPAGKDLRRRLGAPNQDGDVIFGATAIPAEAWPADDQFRLSTDQQRVETSIKAARQQAGYWARELLLSERHPILQWLTERLVMQFDRGSAPLIASRQLQPGELVYLFIGQRGSQAGMPLVVDAHAVSFPRDAIGAGRIEKLGPALQRIGFDRLVNTGQSLEETAARLLLAAAVQCSLDHLLAMTEQRIKELKGPLRREERRLHTWSQKRRALLADQLEALPNHHPAAVRARRQLDEIDTFLDGRKTWRDDHLMPAEAPTTQLILVAQGIQ